MTHHEDILAYIIDYKKENGVEPSKGEIAKHFGRTRGFVHPYLVELEKQGKIQKVEPVQTPSYRLT